MQLEKNKWLVQLRQKNNSLDEFFVEYKHGILCPNMTDHFPSLEETTDREWHRAWHRGTDFFGRL